MDTKVTQVITLNGEIINVGAWDYQIAVVETINNPYTGEGEAPEDWDFQITSADVETNPLPEGAVTEELEIFYGEDGRIRRADQAEQYSAQLILTEKQRQLDALMPDIILGIASQDEIDLARDLRLYIKQHTG